MTETPKVGYDLTDEIGSISYHGKRVGHNFSKNPTSPVMLSAKAEVGPIRIK
ncbi:hypothetical protein KIMC2_02620 [Xylocopilactobacillus apis]|uniref:Uncharacterized protein n=1 Tax=Xylocopilactobacillus apis TaxID=2932183 RepID=A0AAU9D0A1_9LACO|nr:hypothetical protein KIMC2_02620 [Xylocopilactobacillus apis]